MPTHLLDSLRLLVLNKWFKTNEKQRNTVPLSVRPLTSKHLKLTRSKLNYCIEKQNGEYQKFAIRILLMNSNFTGILLEQNWKFTGNQLKVYHSNVWTWNCSLIQYHAGRRNCDHFNVMFVPKNLWSNENWNFCSETLPNLCRRNQEEPGL